MDISIFQEHLKQKVLHTGDLYKIRNSKLYVNFWRNCNSTWWQSLCGCSLVWTRPSLLVTPGSAVLCWCPLLSSVWWKTPSPQRGSVGFHPEGRLLVHNLENEQMACYSLFTWIKYYNFFIVVSTLMFSLSCKIVNTINSDFGQFASKNQAIWMRHLPIMMDKIHFFIHFIDQIMNRWMWKIMVSCSSGIQLCIRTHYKTIIGSDNMNRCNLTTKLFQWWGINYFVNHTTEPVLGFCLHPPSPPPSLIGK